MIHYTYWKKKNHKIVILDNQNYKITRTIDLNQKGLKDDEAELEAIATYKNHFLITDEVNFCIYDYNILKDTLTKINSINLTKDIIDFGIEGITVNQKDNICYILKERDKNYNSIIWEYKITESTNQQIMLSYKNSIVISHPHDTDSIDNWRYSDIVYDVDSRQFFCLKSFYKKIVDSCKYQIDTLETNDSGYTGIKTFEINKLKLYRDISEEVSLFKRNNTDISTNLEGITILHNNIYLISDNCQCPKGKQEHTLFLKLLKY